MLIIGLICPGLGITSNDNVLVWIGLINIWISKL